MIQRIQTVYLALALILMGLLGWLPLGEIANGIQIYTFNIKGIISPGNEVIVNGWPLMMLLVVVAIVQIIIIFSYKKRLRQMRMATFNILLMIGFLGVSWYFVYASLKTIGDDGAYVFELPMSFPLISTILNYLAIRAIGKDEALVRSVDRIR